MNIEAEFKYCPKCKGDLVQKDKNLIICQVCRTHFYINPRPTNALILEDEKGQILLVKRNSEPEKGKWDLPGGFVDINESLENSLKRELKEELDIDIKDYRYVGSYTGRYNYQGINYYTLCFVFAGKLPQQNINLNEEISDMEFFPKNKIPFDQIAFIETKNGLKDYLKKEQLPPSQ